LSEIALLRHTLATLAYRGGKAISGAPAEFASFDGAGSARTPARILAHIGDLLDWALSLAEGRQAWKDSTPLPWEEERQRFFAALHALDARLGADAPIAAPAGKLFQGPIADALTHVGQIAMRRRLAGCPIRGENYFKAEIVAGRLGADQSARRAEFD
jgi:hypothetical protein